ncbi:MAG: hypothetical protein COA88_05135 [Kordia sp.]|nr:MAG: hypothetical protein COA88_05135 [Kordia sp.]
MFFLSCSTVKNTSDKGIDDLTVYNAILDNDSDGNYGLEGRLPLRRPVPIYTCSKEGRVVVLIKVDRTGRVVEATPGVKGSTTKNKCLLSRSKEAALKTKWQAAANAPEKQIGKIVYNFSLR